VASKGAFPPAGAAGAPGGEAAASPPLSPLLFLGFAIASIGGPLALPTLFPGTAGAGVRSAGLVIALSLAVFAVPLAIWLSYSRDIVSAGGLSAFVAAAAGRRAALAHGWIWTLAYFLYLPYTVTFVVYDLLTPVFPGISPYRSALELLLPVALVLTALSPIRLVLGFLGALAAGQLVLMLVLGGVEFSHASGSLLGHPTLEVTGRATGNTALLFACASLPLYLGSEVRGGSRTVRRSLAGAVAVSGAAFLVVGIPFAALPDQLRNSAVPGAAIAQAYSGRGLAIAVGLVTAASTLALIVAEYLALARLLHWLHGPSLRTALVWIALPFVAADAVSLLNPERFYSDLLKPSLGALLVSQLLVVLVFPHFRRNQAAIAAATVATSLAVWGLYTLLAGASPT
jgi:hypothetical protein